MNAIAALTYLGRKFFPVVSHSGLAWISVPQKDGEFSGEELRASSVGVRPRPMLKLPLGKSLHKKPKPLSVVGHRLDRRAFAVSKQKQSAAERVFARLPLRQCHQSVHAVTEVHALRKDEDPRLGRKLNHDRSAENKEPRSVLVGSVTVIRPERGPRISTVIGTPAADASSPGSSTNSACS